MKAVVIHDDFDVVGNATTLLDLVSPSEDEAWKWSVKSYQFEQLKGASVAEAALFEATDADLIVLALNHPAVLPSWMVNWLESWAGRRHVEDPAFVVLSGSSAGHRTALRELREFADRHALNCIYDDEASADDEQPGFVRSALETLPQPG